MNVNYPNICIRNFSRKVSNIAYHYIDIYSPIFFIKSVQLLRCDTIISNQIFQRAASSFQKYHSGIYLPFHIE